MILFAPLGVALALRRAGLLKVALAGALFSIGVEAAQYFVVPGRQANLGDVLANTAGVVVGFALFRAHPWTAARGFGFRRSLITAFIASSALIVGLTLLTQVFPRPVYSLLWTPRYEGHDLYLGKVLSTRVGPLQWLTPVPMQPGDSVRQLLKNHPIELKFIAGPPTWRLAPIVTIHDGYSREIIQLGAHGVDLIFRYWGAGDEVRLDHADMRIERVFAGITPGDTVDMSWRFTRDGYCLRWNERTECGHGFTVADTWSLLISMDWSNVRSRAAGVLWLVGVFFMVGFVTTDKRVLFSVIVFSATALAGGPLLVGFAITPWYQLVAAMIGLVIGHLIAGLFVRRETEMPNATTREPLAYHETSH